MRVKKLCCLIGLCHYKMVSCSMNPSKWHDLPGVEGESWHGIVGLTITTQKSSQNYDATNQISYSQQPEGDKCHKANVKVQPTSDTKEENGNSNKIPMSVGQKLGRSFCCAMVFICEVRSKIGRLPYKIKIETVYLACRFNVKNINIRVNCVCCRNMV